MKEREPLAFVGRATCGMLHAVYEGVVPKSARALDNTITDTWYRDCLQSRRPHVSEHVTETMLLRTLDQTTLAPPFVTEAAGKRYKQTAEGLRVGDLHNEKAGLSLGFDQQIRLSYRRSSFKRTNKSKTEGTP